MVFFLCNPHSLAYKSTIWGKLEQMHSTMLICMKSCVLTQIYVWNFLFCFINCSNSKRLWNLDFFKNIVRLTSEGENLNLKSMNRYFTKGKNILGVLRSDWSFKSCILQFHCRNWMYLLKSYHWCWSSKQTSF